MHLKVEEALRIIEELDMPQGQKNERTAYCLLALLHMSPEKKWADAETPLIGITPIMEFTRNFYSKEYAPNSRETFRRFSIHQFIEAGIACYNPDDPGRSVNSPKAVYQISPAALILIKTFGTNEWPASLEKFKAVQSSLSELYAHEREQNMVKLKVLPGRLIQLSPGEHNELIKVIIEDMAPRFLPEGILIYIGDTGEKWGYYDETLAVDLFMDVDKHGKMPDVVIYCKNRNWLVLIESVISHGPVDSKRYLELKRLFSSITADLVFISAFPNKSVFSRYLCDIAWETEVWIADNPTHMIHFNGDKFIGPYKK